MARIVLLLLGESRGGRSNARERLNVDFSLFPAFGRPGRRL
jgi:hypothetical protein